MRGAERSRVRLSLELTGTKGLRRHPGHGPLRITHFHPAGWPHGGHDDYLKIA